MRKPLSTDMLRQGKNAARIASRNCGSLRFRCCLLIGIDLQKEAKETKKRKGEQPFFVSFAFFCSKFLSGKQPAMLPPAHRPTVVLSLYLVGVLFASIGCQRDASSSDPSAAVNKIELAAEGDPAVELVIDYGDGVQKRFTRIPLDEGMTVLGAMRFAAEHPRGITFEKSGAGASALLTKIDDLANQAGGGDKNWLYRVNGKLATKSFDAYVLAPGDVILWRFEKYERVVSGRRQAGRRKSPDDAAF